jgi:hypothetical protein
LRRFGTDFHAQGDGPKDTIAITIADGVRADEFVSTSVLRGSTQSRCGTTTLADSQPRCANLCEKFRLALRRHDQWLAPATTPRDLGATAELQLTRCMAARSTDTAKAARRPNVGMITPVLPEKSYARAPMIQSG